MAVREPVRSALCVPQEAQLLIDRNAKLSGSEFAINDAQGNLLLDVKSKTSGFHPFAQTSLVLRDASGKVLLLLTKKKWSSHGKWVAYRGYDEIEENLLFTIGHSSVFQMTISYEVFLATNLNSSIPDFTVKKDLGGKSYTFLYYGTPFAEARKRNGVSILPWKKQYVVTVYPGADQAFLAALLVVFADVILFRIRLELKREEQLQVQALVKQPI